jgi:hypothetical protein
MDLAHLRSVWEPRGYRGAYYQRRSVAVPKVATG